MTPLNITDEQRRNFQRSTAVWRWVFLCASTALGTLLVMWVNGGLFLNTPDYPFRAGFVGVVYAATTIFLLVVSPFFFRRLRALAIPAWLLAILAAIWVSLTVFLPVY